MDALASLQRVSRPVVPRCKPTLRIPRPIANVSKFRLLKKAGLAGDQDARGQLVDQQLTSWQRATSLAGALEISVELAASTLEQVPRLQRKSDAALRAKIDTIAAAVGLPRARVAQLLVVACPEELLRSPANIVGRLQAAAAISGPGKDDSHQAIDFGQGKAEAAATSAGTEIGADGAPPAVHSAPGTSRSGRSKGGQGKRAARQQARDPAVADLQRAFLSAELRPELLHMQLGVLRRVKRPAVLRELRDANQEADEHQG